MTRGRAVELVKVGAPLAPRAARSAAGRLLLAGAVAVLAPLLAVSSAAAANGPTFRDCSLIGGLDPDFVQLSGVMVGPTGRLTVALGLSAACFASSAAASTSTPCTTAAAGGDWPSYGHDVANTRTQPEETRLGPSAVAALTPAWAFSTSSTADGTGFNTTPVVYDG